MTAGIHFCFCSIGNFTYYLGVIDHPEIISIICFKIHFINILTRYLKCTYQNMFSYKKLLFKLSCKSFYNCIRYFDFDSFYQSLNKVEINYVSYNIYCIILSSVFLSSKLCQELFSNKCY